MTERARHPADGPARQSKARTDRVLIDRGGDRHKARSPLPWKVVVVRTDSDLTVDEAITDFFKDVEARLKTEAEYIRIDMEKVPAANTKTVACLLRLRRMAGRAGVVIEIRPSEAVREWIRVCKVDWLLVSETPERQSR